MSPMHRRRARGPGVRSRILSLIESLSPAFRQRLRRYASLRAWQRHARDIQPVIDKITSEHGWVVQAGPFAGMRYVRQAKGSVLLPKLLGIYERELFDAIRTLSSRAPDAVVDVGCAEGYYAVGLARTVPTAAVYAFDIDPEAQRLCRMLAVANAVDERLRVAGACDAAALQSILETHRRVLVVSDCEGFEGQLLDPARAPGLARADLLVEVHEFARPGVTEVLLQRFHSTHTVTRIPADPIDPESVTALAEFDDETRRKSTSEFRPAGMEWLLCLTRS